jgi:protein-disulfide isomerase
MKHLILSIIFIVSAVSAVSQFPEKFVYLDPTSIPSNYNPLHSVVIEAFLDLQCPDSKASFPIITQLPSLYPSGAVLLQVSLFPLVFHRNAFYAAQAAQVVYSNFIRNATSDMEAAKNWRKVFDFSKAYFAAQDSLTNVATDNVTADEILDTIAEIFETSTGMAKADTLVGLQYGNDYDHYARTLWHYGISRAVPGTPTFFVNGILVADADQTWTIQQWQTLLDPLVSNSKHTLM